MWTKIKKWFHDSEVIAWSRLQAFGGLLMAALAGINWTTIFTAGFEPKTSFWVGVGLIANGLFQEYLRKRRAPDM